MNLLRLISGWACIAVAIVVIVVILLGGLAGSPGVPSSSPALMAHLPRMAFGLALLAVGAWLIKGRKSS